MICPMKSVCYCDFAKFRTNFFNKKDGLRQFEIVCRPVQNPLDISKNSQVLFDALINLVRTMVPDTAKRLVKNYIGGYKMSWEIFKSYKYLFSFQQSSKTSLATFIFLR